MLNSLRFRLPALFLAGIALAGLVTSLIALRLFQDFTRTESLKELRQEATRPRRSLRRVGGARARREQGRAGVRRLQARERNGRPPVRGRPRAAPFLGEDSGLRRLTRADVGVELSTGEDRDLRVRASRARTGRTSPRRIRSGSAASEGVTFSFLIVAKPKAELRRDVDHPALAARDRIPRRPRHRRRARALPLATDHEAGARALEGDGPGCGGTP